MEQVISNLLTQPAVYIESRRSEEGHSHAGILITEQHRNRQLGKLLRRLLRSPRGVDTVTADEMRDAVRYLSEFR